MKNPNKRNDLKGMKFGRWTVLCLDETPHKGKACYWVCQCECGTIRSVRGDGLVNGTSKSCGCLKREISAINVSKNHKHKMSGTRIYHEWQSMKDRCFNENNSRWSRYGGRGITVCDGWKNDFQTFYDWAIANGYQDDLTLDRIDNDGNYCPENCRWATQVEQGRNRRTNIEITIGNSTRTLTEWCEIFQIDYKAAYARYKRNGNCTLEGLFNFRQKNS